MRRPLKEKQKHPAAPDPLYGSVTVSKLINYVNKDGEKATASRIVYAAFTVLKEKHQIDDPVGLLEMAIQNIAPTMEVRSRRVGGANYQVPFPVRPERQLALALRWILEAVRGKSGSPFAERLASELLAASKTEGEAIKKRENVHKMAEANKAFAHFAFSNTKKR